MVLLGFTDPDLPRLRSDARIVSRRGRMLFLQLAAPKGWAMEKGDVVGAFLQGRQNTEDGRRGMPWGSPTTSSPRSSRPDAASHRRRGSGGFKSARVSPTSASGFCALNCASGSWAARTVPKAAFVYM